MPIVTRIGIMPKSTKGKIGPKFHAYEGYNLIKKMPVPIESFVTNKERLRIDYYLNKTNAQNETADLAKVHANQPTHNTFVNKGAYALLDNRSVVQGLKYTGTDGKPVDVWSWDPKKDRKAKAQADAGMRRLKSMGRSHDEKKIIMFFDEIDKILTQYLSDKFNLSAYGTTR